MFQNILTGNKPKVDDKSGVEKAAAPASSDEVQISNEAQEALSVAQAEEATRAVSSALQEDLNRVLGIDPTFAEQVSQS